MDERTDDVSQPPMPPLPEPRAAAEQPAAPQPPAAESAVEELSAEDGIGGGANVKETLESILVAFILAFIFRCFVVEPFVIPTGSMAPTLMGAHSHFECPDCGYRFDVNYSSPERRGGDRSGSDARASADDFDIPDRVPGFQDEKKQWVDAVYDSIYCPNCGLRLPPVISPRVLYGDRIIVLKYLYLLHEPQRWDVVVFKSPAERDYAVNYIKRLIGKPGETIMVLDGDIYLKSRGADQFEIARKTRTAQEALWRILYDNDYHPVGNQPRRTPWQQPWQQTAGAGKWSTERGGGRVFAFGAADASGTLTFNDEANLQDTKATPFGDWIAYDQRHSTHNNPTDVDVPWRGEFPVSDLKLDLYYSRTSGTGPLKLRLTKLGHAFTAVITPDSVRLVHEVEQQGGKRSELSVPLPGARSAAPLHVQFMNVDYRVVLRIDGVDVLSTTDADYSPDIRDLLRRHQEWAVIGDTFPRQRPIPFLPPSVSITADHQTCELSHISLWRDVYYTPKLTTGHSIQWGSPQMVAGGAAGPITLGEDEYFVMGDNSPLSNDARFWDKPIDLLDEGLHVAAGRVPGRFMLGKAFFVYWPAGFRPMERAPGIIPNFGQMRFIR
jgi:signal peptidase I